MSDQTGRLPFSVVDDETFTRLIACTEEDENGCWIWKGAVSSAGYGRLGNRYTHRMMVEVVGWTIPKGMVVCHSCDMKTCCNPDHLFIGTQSDNIRDMHKKGRHLWSNMAACIRGHTYTPGSYYFRNNSRHCIECAKRRAREWKEKRKTMAPQTRSRVA